MSNQLYGADREAKITVRVSSDLKEEYQAALDGPMSDDLRQHIEAVAEGTHGSREEYRPYEPDLNELYQACLTHSDKKLRLKPTRHAARVAETVRFVSKNDLDEALRPLRRQGFVAAKDGAPVVVEPRRVYCVKPLAVDPVEWARREQFE
jgi:hypothetical protein